MLELKNDVSTAEGLTELNNHLATRSYIEGHKPTQQDVYFWRQVSLNVDSKALPHVARWHSHINSFTSCQRKRWSGDVLVAAEKKSAPAAKAEQKKPAAKAAKKKSSSPFDDDEEEEAPAAASSSSSSSSSSAAAAPKAKSSSPFDDDEDGPAIKDDESDDEIERQKRIDEIAAKKKAADAAKGKVEVIARSQLILDVKPLSDETDMAALEAKIRAIKQEGLDWKGAALVDIAYGVKKLRITCNMVDELVSVSDLEDKIQGMEDDVQSTDVYAFNKL